jgi:hypothetical protein
MIKIEAEFDLVRAAGSGRHRVWVDMLRPYRPSSRNRHENTKKHNFERSAKRFRVSP